MANPSQQIEQFIPYTPVDWGIGVVKAHWRMLFLLSLPVLAAEMIAGYVLYIEPLTPKVMFVVSLLLNGTHSWLLSALLMYLVSLMRREHLGLMTLSRRAMVLLPKVFISYSVFSMLVSVGIRVPPALVMLFFFMWAPAFCAVETYAIKEEDPIEDEDEVYDDEFDFDSPAHYRSRSFMGVPVWDFGISRSMQLVGQHMLPCLQVFVLYWAAVVVPLAFVYAAISQPFGLAGQLLQFFVSTVCSVAALAIWAGAFLSLLSENAFEELGLTPEDFHEELLVGEQPWRLTSVRPGLFLAVAVIALGSSLYYDKMSNQLEDRPSSAILEGERISREDDVVAIKLRMTDEERQYRWLELEEFRLVFDETRIPNLSGFGGAVKASQREGVKPIVDSSLIYDADGKLLHPSFFKPHYGEASVILRFPISKGSEKQERLFLYYGKGFQHGLDEPVYQGALPADEPQE